MGCAPQMWLEPSPSGNDPNVNFLDVTRESASLRAAVKRFKAILFRFKTVKCAVNSDEIKAGDISFSGREARGIVPTFG